MIDKSYWRYHFLEGEGSNKENLLVFFTFWPRCWYVDLIIGCLYLYILQALAGKNGHKVEVCPKNTKEWQIASKRLNCANYILNPKNKYHCLPANDLSTLVEFCYNETRPGVGKGIFLFCQWIIFVWHASIL